MKQMTRIFLTASVFACISAVSSIGQTFSIDNVQQAKDDGTGLYKAQLRITNQSSSDKSLKVVAFLEEKNPEHISYFCTGTLCYGPATLEAEYPMSATKTDDFISYLMPEGINAVSKIRYEFSDAANPSDKIEYTFVFNIGVTSIVESQSYSFVALSSPVPNPVRDVATIHYVINEASFKNATIELYAADSRVLRTIALSEANGSLQIETGSLPAGMYFYSLVIDGKKINTNKLTVVH